MYYDWCVLCLVHKVSVHFVRIQIDTKNFKVPLYLFNICK